MVEWTLDSEKVHMKVVGRRAVSLETLVFFATSGCLRGTAVGMLCGGFERCVRFAKRNFSASLDDLNRSRSSQNGLIEELDAEERAAELTGPRLVRPLVSAASRWIVGGALPSALDKERRALMGALPCIRL